MRWVDHVAYTNNKNLLGIDDDDRIIFWHVELLLGNKREINNYTTAADR
jgi:hypothetical protein